MAFSQKEMNFENLIDLKTFFQMKEIQTKRINKKFKKQNLTQLYSEDDPVFPMYRLHLKSIDSIQSALHCHCWNYLNGYKTDAVQPDSAQSSSAHTAHCWPENLFQEMRYNCRKHDNLLLSVKIAINKFQE